jgi:probable rRNA maturation factor
VTHLLIHGFLHLLGYDHMNPRQAKKMESFETELMMQLGYKNPYANL